MLNRLIIVGLLIFCAIFSFRAIVALTGFDSTKKNISYDPLPPEKEGGFPIEMPKYNGVDQLLVLSNRWVIVATRNVDEVVKMLDVLTDGSYSKNLATFEQSDILVNGDKKPNWGARDTYLKIRDEYYAQAREMTGELDLDQDNYYDITSSSDSHYKEQQHPKRVTRYLVSLGKGSPKTGNEVDYAQYSYLEMPFPLENGNQYTITLHNGKSVTFNYDEMRTVSRSIKVNQLGYLSDAEHKYAYLGGYLHEFGPLDLSYAKEFYVVSAKDGQMALQGQVKLRAKNQRMPPNNDEKDPNKRPFLNGEDVYELDLSPLKQEGDFFIVVPGVGRSWTFHNGKDTYGEAFYTQVRGLYHQRCGEAITAKYSAWTRDKCGITTVYESQEVPFWKYIEIPKDYETFDVIGATLDVNKKTENVTGGWFDAADYDRNITHYNDVFDLLEAYELAPNKFYDGQLNIPESGNGIPDILDEAEFGILAWKKSMRPDGGVAGRIEANSHYPWAEGKYAFSVRTRWSSLLFAAAAAQYSYLVAPFNKQKADEYKALALKAYQFGNNPKNALKDFVIPAAKDRGKGAKYSFTFTETDKDIVPYLIAARLRLYILTNDKAYLEGMPELLSQAPHPMTWPFSVQDMSIWFYFPLFSNKVSKELPPNIINTWKGYYLEVANDILKETSKQPYRFSWPLDRDYWMAWGNTVMTNQARALLVAFLISGDKKYKEAAISNVDYMMGVNPMGMSWTTGIGYVYPIEIQHEFSLNDGIMDPVPGILIYGFSGGVPSQLVNLYWQTKKPNGTIEQFMKPINRQLPVWRTWFVHPFLNVAQNEFTIHETMSAALFDYAILMSEGWMPPDSLKKKNPRRDEYLFGFWYLP